MMKNLLWIILFFSGICQAQNSESARQYYGVKGGLNATKILTDTVDIERTFLPYAGLGYYYRLKELPGSSAIGIHSSVLYSVRGSNVSSPFLKYRYQQFEIPVGLSYSWKSNIHLTAGFNQSFTISAKVFKTDRKDYDKLNVSSFQPLTELFAGIDLSLKLTKDIRTDLNFRYLLPLTNTDFESYRIGISYYLSDSRIDELTTPTLDPVYYQIVEMKHNPVLVRLQDSRSRIRTLEQNGMFSRAEELRQQQDSLNKAIIRAFRDTFSFTDYYFFFSSDTRKVLQGDFEGIFLDDSLKHDSSIQLQLEKFYIIEFSFLSTGGGKSMEALMVKDSQLHILEKPFPYLIRRHEILLTKNDAVMIAELNSNLFAFYQLAKAKIKEHEATVIPGNSR